MKDKEIERHIIFFDGVCNLCNDAVDFIIRRDTQQIFKYAPLQGETAKRLLNDSLTQDLKTIVYYENEENISIKSKAALNIASRLSFPWNLLAAFKIIPSFISDILYQLISKYRYKVFGKRETCRLPTESEKKLFLD